MAYVRRSRALLPNTPVLAPSRSVVWRNQLKRGARSSVAPLLALIEFLRHVMSPGLSDQPTLPTYRISNGGQHRY